jgi:hypothetical protein
VSDGIDDGIDSMKILRAGLSYKVLEVPTGRSFLPLIRSVERKCWRYRVGRKTLKDRIVY